MIRLLLAVLVLAITIITVEAKEKKGLIFLLHGHIGVQGGELFNYKLELKDSIGDYMSGFAYTYSEIGKEVKAGVVAEINPINQTLRLKEQTIEYNRGFKSKAIICLVHANLQYDDMSQELVGQLTTQTNILGANCSSGSISFSNKVEIETIFDAKRQDVVIATDVKTQATPQQLAKHNRPKVIVRETNLNAPPRIEPIISSRKDNVTDGKDKTYEWENDEVELAIWDGTTVDNDRVTIHWNGEEKLRNYTLTKDKKILKLRIGGNELNILTITAMNEGNEPPNTADILLKDGDKEYAIVAHNRVGKKAIIKIRKIIK